MKRHNTRQHQVSINMVTMSLGWLGLVLLLSCASMQGQEYVSLAELVAANQAGLAKLKVGLTEDSVMAAMGTEVVKTPEGIVNNPWARESFTDKDDAEYDVLYYLTTENQAFTPIRKALTTPVVLKNGLVVGWGDAALQRALAQRQEVPAATWGRGLPNP
ncbi:MAG: DUF3192 domain-containing protein [Candidatus Competibacteraceae bacterium]